MVSAGSYYPLPHAIAAEHPQWAALIEACCRLNPDKRPSMFTVLRKLEALKATYK